MRCCLPRVEGGCAAARPPLSRRSVQLLVRLDSKAQSASGSPGGSPLGPDSFKVKRSSNSAQSMFESGGGCGSGRGGCITLASSSSRRMVDHLGVVEMAGVLARDPPQSSLTSRLATDSSRRDRGPLRSCELSREEARLEAAEGDEKGSPPSCSRAGALAPVSGMWVRSASASRVSGSGTRLPSQPTRSSSWITAAWRALCPSSRRPMATRDELSRRSMLLHVASKAGG
mmetsp:Transcript_24678/g.76786  ORF Transcript_24678/g.76786 Transcript_24678/m.76786 type:complete len:229 (-) Transcript_24678:339-1025(-)